MLREMDQNSRTNGASCNGIRSQLAALEGEQLQGELGSIWIAFTGASIASPLIATELSRCNRLHLTPLASLCERTHTLLCRCCIVGGRFWRAELLTYSLQVPMFKSIPEQRLH